MEEYNGNLDFTYFEKQHGQVITVDVFILQIA